MQHHENLPTVLEAVAVTGHPGDLPDIPAGLRGKLRPAPGAANLLVPAAGCGPADVRAYLRWRQGWARTVLVGVDRDVAAMLDAGGTPGRLAAEQLQLGTAGRQWVELGVSQLAAVVRNLDRVEERLASQGLELNPVHARFLRQALGEGLRCRRLFLGPLVDAGGDDADDDGGKRATDRCVCAPGRRSGPPHTR
jgi:hypothetical protein